jgi:hypothetical protein
VSEVAPIIRRAPMTREAAIEKEMEVRLQNVASSHEQEGAILRLRLREAEIGIAIKEQELANSKAAGDIIQMEANFKRRILEVQLQTEEAKLQRVVILIMHVDILKDNYILK